MSKNRPMECPYCKQTVTDDGHGVPRIHYLRGTLELCPGRKEEGETRGPVG